MMKGNFSIRPKKELGYKWEIWQKGFSEVQDTYRRQLCPAPNYIDGPVRRVWRLSGRGVSVLLNVL